MFYQTHIIYVNGTCGKFSEFAENFSGTVIVKNIWYEVEMIIEENKLIKLLLLDYNCIIHNIFIRYNIFY